MAETLEITVDKFIFRVAHRPVLYRRRRLGSSGRKSGADWSVGFLTAAQWGCGLSLK